MNTRKYIFIICLLSIAFVLASCGNTVTSNDCANADEFDLAGWLRAWAAFGSLGVSLLAIGISIRSTYTAKRNFRRQGVIQLFNAWKGACALDPKNPITQDIVHTINVMELTAHSWNHDIVEKAIIYQQYGETYRKLYDTLKTWTDEIPGINKRGCDMLTREMGTAFSEMLRIGPSLPTSTHL